MYFREKNKIKSALKAIRSFYKVYYSPKYFWFGELIFFQLRQQQFTYFLSIIQWKTGWNKDIF